MKDTSGENHRDSGVLSNPLSFRRSGRFGWGSAGLNNLRGSYGNYWSLHSAGTTGSFCLYFNNSYLSSKDISDHGLGFAVRCVGTSKSFTTLINTSYSMKNDGQTSENSRDSGVLSNPLSFVHSGYFSWNNADLNVRGSYGNSWSPYSINTTGSDRLDFSDTSLEPRYGSYRGFGFAVLLLRPLLQ